MAASKENEEPRSLQTGDRDCLSPKPQAWMQFYFFAASSKKWTLARFKYR
jgi:hypothetical protein